MNSNYLRSEGILCRSLLVFVKAAFVEPAVLLPLPLHDKVSLDPDAGPRPLTWPYWSVPSVCLLFFTIFISYVEVQVLLLYFGLPASAAHSFRRIATLGRLLCALSGSNSPSCCHVFGVSAWARFVRFSVIVVPGFFSFLVIAAFWSGRSWKELHIVLDPEIPNSFRKLLRLVHSGPARPKRCASALTKSFFVLIEIFHFIHRQNIFTRTFHPLFYFY